jgi:hypothetical protein
VFFFFIQQSTFAFPIAQPGITNVLSPPVTPVLQIVTLAILHAKFVLIQPILVALNAQVKVNMRPFFLIQHAISIAQEHQHQIITLRITKRINVSAPK